MNRVESKKKLEQLVQQFEKYESTYSASDYKEATLRSSFLDPFFELFGWEMRPERITNPADLEVIIEESLETEKSTKYIDYVFKINRTTQFLVEAKKPAESLSKKDHIFQAKSYAFTTEIPFVILTNFKEFRFYDVSTEPLHNQPDTDKVEEYCFDYKEYVQNFDKLWELFSREAVANRSLAKFYAKRRNIVDSPDLIFKLNYQIDKGASLLDISFLKNLKIWRKSLAENIFNNNSLNVNVINEVVQRILDRLIFIRIIEDRNIESKEFLKEIVEMHEQDNSISVKNELDKLCIELNKKFNGLVFHDHTFVNEALIDNEILIVIIDNLYYPKSPYNFRLIKPEILGRIFEQFLGEKIEIIDGKITLGLKDINKKSGGVYYTPSYIVEKIVENTLSKKLHNDITIENLEQIKIADIACGSGSFLISSYKYLIDKFQYIYSKCSEADVQTLISNNLVFIDNGKLMLTMEHKKGILQQNIFGVDIDSQAIQVAKLSLYITMLEEGYREGTLRPILPDLNDNIKHGNSIIDNEILFEDDINYDIDATLPFDWEYAFPDIIDNGGFDVILGNPPYIRIQIFEELYGKDVVNYLKKKYVSAEKFNFDIYVVFIEKALSLLNDQGILGYIVMNKFFTTQYGEKLRELITSQKLLYEIIDFGINEIFNNATTYTCILILDKTNPDEIIIERVIDLNTWKAGESSDRKVVDHTEFTSTPWYLSSNTDEEIYKFFEENMVLLETISDRVFVGVQTDCDPVYILEEVYEEENYLYCKSEYTTEVHKFEKDHLKPFLKGSLDIKKYTFSNVNKWLLFPYTNSENTSDLIPETTYKQYFPETWKYLESCKERLAKRKSIERELDINPNYNEWYKYIYKKNHTRMDQLKIVFPAISKGSSFCYDSDGEYYFVGSGAGGGGGGAIVLPDQSDYNYLSLLGILNSEVVSYQIVRRGSKHKGSYYGVDKKRIENLYVPLINEDNKNLFSNISKMVAQILDAFQKMHQAGTTDVGKEQLQQRIKMLNARINELVYRLYNLPVEYKEYIKNALEN
uniref:site-specific DNA-methyltransferase (adenine-specific) n=1 Tax=Lysinibacillus sphaericus TaxID=1421 RepID=E5Q8V5_LYSSH|nr:RM.BsgI [Lysinibacillus sphaericus]